MEEIKYPKEIFENSDKNSSEIEKYYKLINKNLEEDLNYTKLITRASWALIAILCIVFVYVLCEGATFWNGYLDSVKNGSKNIPSDKIVITYLLINSAKLVGIIGVLAKFFSKKFNNNLIIKT